MSDILRVGNIDFSSRLIVGSGKYPDFQTTKDATIASGSKLITVAVRRVNITNPNEENLMDYFKGTDIKLLPNSAGCTTAEDAITLFRDGRMDELKQYCLDDVRLTRQIFEYGLTEGKIFFTSTWDYKTYEIPVEWKKEVDVLFSKPQSAPQDNFPSSLF